MDFTFCDKFWRHLKSCPLVRFLGQMKLYWDLEIIGCKNFREVLFSTCLISSFVAELSKLCLMLLEKQSSIQTYEWLFPHFHNEVMTVKCIFSLLLTVLSKHGQHRMDANQFVVVRTVHKSWIGIFFLPFRKWSCCFLCLFWARWLQRLAT